MNNFRYAFAPAVAMSAAIVQAGLFYQAPHDKPSTPHNSRNIFFGVVPSTASGSTVVYPTAGIKTPAQAVDEAIAGFYAKLAGSQSAMDAELENILFDNLSSLYSRS